MQRSASPEWNPSRGDQYAVSKDGYSFDPQAPYWKLNKDITVSVGFDRILPVPLRTGFRATLQRYAEEMSAAHTSGCASLFKRYLKDTKAGAVTITGLLNWRAKLGVSNQWWMGALRTFLCAWNGYGLPGVSDEVVALLKGWRIKGCNKGVAVITSNPTTGPYTDIEIQALIDWANMAVSSRTIRFASYAQLLTLLITARRTVQIAALRGKDLIEERTGSVSLFRLNVPRAKQRGGGFRRSFRSVAVIDDLYTVLRHQHRQSVALVEKAVGAELPENLKFEVPIFINEMVAKKIANVHTLTDLLLGTKPDVLHATVKSLKYDLRRIAELCTVRSERTGEPIRIFARRFRYTRGTKLRREGFSPFVIAELLDHSDIQNVAVYTKNTAQEAVTISELVGAKLAPFAQACLGTLVPSEREAIRGDDPSSRVPNHRQHPIGTCGNYGFCSAGFKACYTCRFFQPWMYGPHDEVLRELYVEKRRARAAGCAEEVVNADDRLILAVEDCLARCKVAMQKACVVATA